MNHEHNHPWLDKLSLIVILLSLLVFTLETMPELNAYLPIFRKLEIGFVVVFTVEYIYRLIKAKKKREFIFSLYGIIDLLSILPFYLSFGLADFQWVRILRIVRVFRIFKLARYVKAIERLLFAIARVKEELLVFLMVAFVMIYLAAVGVYFFEHKAQPEHFTSILHALWFAVVTLTTVGYGDVYPVTAGGKIFTGFILLLGLGLISVPSGLLAGSFSEVFKTERRKDKSEAET